MSFNFKRHNNTYEFLQRHNFVLQNCVTQSVFQAEPVKIVSHKPFSATWCAYSAKGKFLSGSFWERDKSRPKKNQSPVLRSFLVLKEKKDPSLLAGILMIFPVILLESVENGTCVPKKEICCRAHVGKWAARQQERRNVRYVQTDYYCACSAVHVYKHVCSRPSAFTSRRHNVMTSAHFPTCVLQQTSFLGTKVPFLTDSQDLQITSSVFLRKGCDSPDIF